MASSDGATAARNRILVVGSINADVFIDIDRLPLPGETLAASRPDTGHVFPGGKGANQAVAVAKSLKAGGPFEAYWCGRFGNDAHVSMLKDVLTSHKVNFSLATEADVPSGQAYILLMKDGQNSIILVGAANHSWPAELPAPLLSSLDSAAVVMLQREIPDAVNLAVATAAKAHGVPVFLDLGGEDTPISPALLSSLTFLTANETELARVVKLPTDSDEQALTAARHVQAQFGVPNLLLTLGSRGAMLLLQDGSVVTQPACKVDKIVDTTGAGDCFRGAFTVAYLEKRPWSECLAFASAAAAICIQTKGALPSMPAREQVEQMLAKQ